MDRSDGSREFYKRTRETDEGCALQDIMNVVGGGEDSILRDLRSYWDALRVRTHGDDGTGERMYMLLAHKVPASLLLVHSDFSELQEMLM